MEASIRDQNDSRFIFLLKPRPARKVRMEAGKRIRKTAAGLFLVHLRPARKVRMGESNRDRNDSSRFILRPQTSRKGLCGGK